MSTINFKCGNWNLNCRDWLSREKWPIKTFYDFNADLVRLHYITKIRQPWILYFHWDFCVSFVFVIDAKLEEWNVTHLKFFLFRGFVTGTGAWNVWEGNLFLVTVQAVHDRSFLRWLFSVGFRLRTFIWSGNPCSERFIRFLFYINAWLVTVSVKSYACFLSPLAWAHAIRHSWQMCKMCWEMTVAEVKLHCF